MRKHQNTHLQEGSSYSCVCDTAPHSVGLAVFDAEIQIGNVAVLERTAGSEDKPCWLGREHKPFQGLGEPSCQHPAAGAAHRPTGLLGSLHHKAGSLLLAQIPVSEQKGQCCSVPLEDAFHLTHKELASPDTVRAHSEGSQAQTLPTRDSALTFVS